MPKGGAYKKTVRKLAQGRRRVEVECTKEKRIGVMIVCRKQFHQIGVCFRIKCAYKDEPDRIIIHYNRRYMWLLFPLLLLKHTHKVALPVTLQDWLIPVDA